MSKNHIEGANVALNVLVLTQPQATEGRRLCVDGHEFPDRESNWAGDGQFPPFAVFDIDAQENLLPYYLTRKQAEAARDRLMAQNPNQISQFDRIFDDAFDGLREYHSCLTDEAKPAMKSAVAHRYADTGNAQVDYQCLRDAIEGEVARKMSKTQVVTRKTPGCRHLYRATCKGYGTYGWGNTPIEARQKLAENMAVEDADRKARNGGSDSKTSSETKMEQATA